MGAGEELGGPGIAPACDLFEQVHEEDCNPWWFFFFFEGQDFPLVIGEPWVTRQKKKTVLDERREGKQGDKRGGRSLSTVDNENP